MYRLSVALWIAAFLSGSVSSDSAYAAQGCECPPMQLRMLRVESAAEGREGVFRLTNQGSVPVYYALSEPIETARLPYLHPNAFHFSVLRSALEGWEPIITLGSTDQWRGVLAVFPNESLDVSVPMDAPFLEQFHPDATLSLKMSSIATRCEVDSESVRVGDLAGRVGGDDHG